MVENDKHLWDSFDDKQPSAITPQKEVKPRVVFKEVDEKILQLWKEKDKNLYYQYKKGELIGQKYTASDATYDIALHLFIDTIIQGIRDNIEDTVDNIEKKQIKLNQLKTASTVLKESVSVLKSMNFKLDNNLILPIMHGYVHECVKKVLK
tara:strand:+ start:16374 stop:16826 length:453 start_codon:yes stop_codon:yes gene_type:complete